MGSALGKMESLGWVLLFALLFVGYLFANQFNSNTSDNASMILEGRAMLHGNLFMHGWYLPPDSFITTEMPLDALASIFFSGVQLLKITPALLYAATVVGASYLAGRRIADTGSRWLAVTACVALIAFPIGALFGMVTQAPMHIGTLAASLVAFLAYDYYIRHPKSWGALGLFALVTALAIVGDAMAELLIVLPAGILSAWVLWRTRGRDRAAGATLIAALGALLLGVLLWNALVASGTFINGSAPIRLASPALIWAHIQWMLVGVCLLFHISLQQKLGSEQVLFLALNAGFLVVGCLGFILLFRHTLFPRDAKTNLTSLLSWAIVCSILIFLLTDIATGMGQLRYLLPASVYAGILCYAAFGRVTSSRTQLTTVVLAFLLVSALTGGVLLAQTPPPPVPQRQLITFLESHRLTHGFGTYWTANITTLGSNGQVQVLPVVEQGGQILAYRWHANAAWFRGGKLDTANFVVFDRSVPSVRFQDAVINDFGAPQHIYRLVDTQDYVILVWDQPITSASIALITGSSIALQGRSR
jgi:hypothetical protein